MNYMRSKGFVRRCEAFDVTKATNISELLSTWLKEHPAFDIASMEALDFQSQIILIVYYYVHLTAIEENP